MQDIGSIFPLYDRNIEESKFPFKMPPKYDKQVLYSLCREALFVIASAYLGKTKRVLLPAYTCQTVIDPFKQLGWSIFFYPIDKNLKIDTQALLAISNRIIPDIVIAHPYYGMEFDSAECYAIKQLKENGAIIVVDNTQCIFSKERLSFVDYYVGSYRKWFGCPDGAFLEDNDNHNLFQPKEVDENGAFVQKQTDAMFLRGEYFNNSNETIKQISIRLNKEAVSEISGKIRPHKMAHISKFMLAEENVEFNISQRFSNYRLLFEKLEGNSKCIPICENLYRLTTAPLYFPVYVNDRIGIQKKLAQQHIYAPILWPVGTKDVLINSNIEYIFEHLLAIPCDQRYGIEDMEKIISVFND
jgi:dTDP-4-amino-4,6-dideoxygalactose transaminase